MPTIAISNPLRYALCILRSLLPSQPQPHARAVSAFVDLIRPIEGHAGGRLGAGQVRCQRADRRVGEELDDRDMLVQLLAQVLAELNERERRGAKLEQVIVDADLADAE